MWEQLKQGRERCQLCLVDDQTFTLIVILLVAVTSFGLGRWSALESMQAVNERPILVPTPVAVEPAAMASEGSGRPTPLVPADPEPTDSFVASVNGAKYHARNCPGAKQISEQNRIYFKTEQAARAAGYTRAANCTF